VNESRPGVTSTVLKPEQALAYLGMVLERRPNITVAGIAGPGDPFANPEETLRTLELIRRGFPGIFLCVSTNGLALSDYIAELAELNVGSVTVTVNAVDPGIISGIYSWINFRGKTMKGADAAEILMENQFMAIRELKSKDIFVKVNSVVIPGVNDLHIGRIAEAAAKAGADLFNAIALVPSPGTLYENIVEPSGPDMARIRKDAGVFLPQMSHCQRCRADAVGLLGEKPGKEEFVALKSAAGTAAASPRPYLAVASLDGFSIDLHLGEASQFLIYKDTDRGPKIAEIRISPDPDIPGRWQKTAELLSDCFAVISAGAGETPRRVFESGGLEVLFMKLSVEQAVKALFGGKDFRSYVDKEAGCGPDCGGDRLGCS